MSVTAVTITAACVVFAIWVAIAAHGRERGLVFWAAGLAMHGVLYGLVRSQSMLAPLVAAVVANVVLSAALALMAVCGCHLRRCQPSHALIWTPVVLGAIGLYAWQDHATWHALVGNVLFSVQCGLMLGVLWQKRRQNTGRDPWALTFVLIALALVYALKAVAVWTQWPLLQAMANAGPIQTSTPLLFFMSLAWVLIGFELLLHSDDSQSSQG